MDSPVICGEKLPISLHLDNGPLLKEVVICHRRPNHFRRHASVYVIITFRNETKVTIRWSTKPRRTE